MKPFLFYILFFFSSFATVFAQSAENLQQRFRFTIHPASGPIVLDGNLNEPSWQAAEAIDSFYMKFPTDQGRPKKSTIVKVTYDQHNLYIAATMHDMRPYIAPTLKRDMEVFRSDGFGVLIDPVNAKSNGYYFRLNPFNVQAEDMVQLFSDELDYSWDNIWHSETKIFDDHWVAEIAIPFKTLRFKSGQTVWGINFSRNDRKNYEVSCWTHMPVNFNFTDLGWCGAMQWETAPKAPSKNIVLLPYATVGAKQRDGKMSLTGNVGADAKIALNSALNLDLTLNPDFSQTDVDQQVTNLTRFNIFFPEKRTFFLENQDIFSSYGIPPIRPFYSRRIGLDDDGNVIPIAGGARLTGNVSKNTRLGVMNMHTLRKGGYASQNYTAVSVVQKVLSRSVAKAYYLGREGILNADEKAAIPLQAYGRNAGVELAFVNKQGDINAWFGSHHSFKPNVKGQNQFLNLGGGYFGRNLKSFIDFDAVGTNYYTDMGFVARIDNYDALHDSSFRLGFRQFYNENSYNFYPKKGKLSQHGVYVENFLVYNPDWSFNEANIEAGYRWAFNNSADLSASVNHNIVDLKYHVSFVDGSKPLPPAKYTYTTYNVTFASDSRKVFSYEVEGEIGGFYNGRIESLSGGLNLRKQPKLTVGIKAEYNHIHLSPEYGSTHLLLLAPKVEYCFSNKMFWTTFLQYNTQANNININSRFQYRYRPMSDFFVVYTDNYYSDPLFKSKSRALVLKLNYWLNL